ncbi:hypothetical protein [Streptomyces sp. NPDC051561]|uniref:hypothetical protein n=1 Tax=Streptomyces sp. NPDC051561 TaxID=3365658 RepID=UPI0037BBDD57
MDLDDPGRCSSTWHGLRSAVRNEVRSRLASKPLYRRAAKAGNVGAACLLGMLLHEEGDEEAAEKVLREAAKSRTPQALRDLGYFLLQTNRPEQALIPLRRAAESDAAAGALVLLGTALEWTGETEEALRCFTRAARSDDEDAPLAAARLLITEDRDTEAEVFLGPAVAQGVPDALHLRGVIA